ncbi:glycosyltransferase family 4 protein [Cognatishimia sp. F0-27]|uniref:glycosyltransferase family 4 protein n=1 Tax=Cognatishimia sp. F0-27 TaxID=2816855 RepID=UPI001D0C8D33|nr:glycosyltransferase family 4 protein [Cognatishimia sp. F0-27]MCC1494834.1 glycosyltransferase family 4 protein [Cognatishimia sp. F0-27]
MAETVLILLRHYLPGFRFGGPLRSVANLVDHLGDAVDFRIVTLDHDMGDPAPYSAIRTDRWQAVGKAQVLYLSRPPGIGALRRIMDDTAHDLLYLQSAFDPAFSLRPLLANRRRASPVLIAPRGEFSPGALALKARKKSVFLTAAALTGLWRGVTWHATAEPEKADIIARIGASASIAVAANLPSVGMTAPPAAPASEVLRGVFLSRISPKKNLMGALDILAQVSAPMRFTIYGPEEDAAYWAACKARIARLPAHIEVIHGGTLPPDTVRDTLAGHDVFLFPTLGENYGHAIVDALSAGLPLVISDRTPWRGLAAKGVGADLSLDDPGAFAREIDRIAGLDASGRAAMRQAALDMAREIANPSETLTATRAMFRAALARGAPGARR